MEQEGEGRANLFLSFSWNVHFPLPWNIVASGAGAFKLWNLFMGSPGFLGLQTWTKYTTSFPGSLACLQQIVELLHNYLLVSSNICVYILLVLFLRIILTYTIYTMISLIRLISLVN